jgi:hypothetical protein
MWKLGLRPRNSQKRNIHKWDLRCCVVMPAYMYYKNDCDIVLYIVLHLSFHLINHLMPPALYWPTIIILNLNFQTLQTFHLGLIPFHVTPIITGYRSWCENLTCNLEIYFCLLWRWSDSCFYHISSFVTIAQFQCWGCKRLFLSIIYRKQVKPYF